MKSKDDNVRKCIVTGQILEKDCLLRFTVTPDNIVVPDFKKKLPGKGIWVKNSKQALQTAVAKGLFSKAIKTNVKANKELVEMVEHLLRKKGLELTSLARKAGILITGFEKVKEAIKKDKIAFVLEAKDAGDDGHNKIISIAKGLDVFALYSVDELDVALDKVNTVHVAFTKGVMAKTVHNEFKKIQEFLNS